MRKYALFGLLLLLIITAEALITTHKVASLLLHFVVVFTVLFYIISGKERVILPLALPSVLRIVNFSMPVFFPYTVYWFPLVYTPIFASVYIVIRTLGLSAADVGFSAKNLHLYIPLGLLTGFLMSLAEFRILKTEPLVSDLSINSVLTLCIVMYVFVALAEELVFRSVLQTCLEKEFGLFIGLLIAALIFGSMHMSYGLSSFAFALLAGLFIGYVFQKTRSLPFVVAIHGTVNVMVFGIFHFTGTALPLF
ncbi:type II CAAX endopeptidase family protein [Ferroglobus sp.]|uniref:CPBP family intramembrane glutamic endopeptidase n=1 Tax=Ferroglobus sp. TaxID=2614230 RepID=UPI0025B87382|nr:type II CAAX endopeptidase family protein [Ferroglobus sp.]